MSRMNHLDIAGGVDSDDAVACRLRLRADDAELFADDAIEERGLAGVWFADDGDDSSFRHSSKASGCGARSEDCVENA